MDSDSATELGRFKARKLVCLSNLMWHCQITNLGALTEGERLSIVDLLNKLACSVKKLNNVCKIKST